jgi:hypothetical protein
MSFILQPWQLLLTILAGLIPGGHPNSPTCGHPKLLHLS